MWRDEKAMQGKESPRVIWGTEGEGEVGAQALACKMGRAMVPTHKKTDQKGNTGFPFPFTFQLHPAPWVSVEQPQDGPPGCWISGSAVQERDGAGESHEGIIAKEYDASQKADKIMQ